MHPNPAFRKEPQDRARAFAAERGFGALTVVRDGRILAAHIPFLLQGDRIEGHLVRSNPICRALREGPLEALLMVSGPDAYISPDWYGEEDKVPTWNYVAVHLRGPVRLEPQETLLNVLERLSERFETPLPKKPWTHHKMQPETLETMMRQIIPFSMQVTEVDSTFKLNQNRTAEARRGAASTLAMAENAGMEKAQLASLMRQVDEAEA